MHDSFGRILLTHLCKNSAVEHSAVLSLFCADGGAGRFLLVVDSEFEETSTDSRGGAAENHAINEVGQFQQPRCSALAVCSPSGPVHPNH